MTDAEQMNRQTPFDLVGGSGIVRQVVDRFYDLMDEDPSYAELRALHAADLDPMRGSLSGFLTAWLGGPRDWFVAHPGVCMMSVHGRIPVTERTAGQWSEAMGRAIEEAPIDPALGTKMAEALASMARGMIRQAGDAQ